MVTTSLTLQKKCNINQMTVRMTWKHFSYTNTCTRHENQVIVSLICGHTVQRIRESQIVFPSGTSTIVKVSSWWSRRFFKEGVLRGMEIWRSIMSPPVPSHFYSFLTQASCWENALAQMEHKSMIYTISSLMCCFHMFLLVSILVRIILCH